MDFAEIMKFLESRADPAAIEGMARFGITAKKAYGVPTPVLRRLAREIGKDHELAGRLWATGILDARSLATLVDDPTRVTREQMELWVRDFDSWAICDGACLNLFRWTPWAYAKCRQWSSRHAEFVKRAAFSLMAGLTVSDKTAGDEAFRTFLPLIKREAVDERNFVRKAVNWALRQIGKRNRRLNRAAIQTAEEMRRQDSRSARWIAADALRELKSHAVQKRLKP